MSSGIPRFAVGLTRKAFGLLGPFQAKFLTAISGDIRNPLVMTYEKRLKTFGTKQKRLISAHQTAAAWHAVLAANTRTRFLSCSTPE